MKKIWAEHLQRHVIIGACKMPDPHAPMLRMHRFSLVGTTPPAPSSCDYSEPAMRVIRDEEGNDAVGDCVIAEDAHAIAVMSGGAGKLFAYSKAQTLQDYSAIAGYVPGDESTDQGTDPIAALNYRLSKGYADGSRDLGYLQVDASNQAEVKFAIEAFGNLKIWCGLPDAWISSFPTADGFLWDADVSDPNNGHCIGACGYNSPRIVGSNCDGVQIMTWGLIGTMTWAALVKHCTPTGGGGMAVRVNPDWLSAAIGKTPSGFNWHDLINAFDVLGGSLPLPPSPGPVPVPVPSGPLTLAQAQAAVSARIMGGFPLLSRQQASNLASAGLASLPGWAT